MSSKWCQAKGSLMTREQGIQSQKNTRMISWSQRKTQKARVYTTVNLPVVHESRNNGKHKWKNSIFPFAWRHERRDHDKNPDHKARDHPNRKWLWDNQASRREHTTKSKKKECLNETHLQDNRQNTTQHYGITGAEEEGIEGKTSTGNNQRKASQE